MASKNYDSLREIRKGKYDWKVRARVLNLWRGYTISGEAFKLFNLLLLDNKVNIVQPYGFYSYFVISTLYFNMHKSLQKCRIHAYVPADKADKMESQLVVGNIYLFQNFTVKEYRKDDKFRPIHKDIQIVFSNDTKVVSLDESDVLIEQEVFDFYDISDLKQLSKQTTYLTGMDLKFVWFCSCIFPVFVLFFVAFEISYFFCLFEDVIGVIKTPQPTLTRVNSRRGGQQSQIKFDITDGRLVKCTIGNSL